jgi:tripartite-type tricarboxylate transporter receptor subunit TctC
MIFNLISVIKRFTIMSMLILLPTLSLAWPNKPIVLVTPGTAGGPTDVIARHLAISMSKHLKQPIVVENRPGAGLIVSIDHTVRSRPDGYTILISNIGISTLPALNNNLNFNPLTDLSYIGEIVDVPMILVAANNLPIDNLQQFIKWSQQNKDKVNYGNAGSGTASHLCGLLLMNRLDANWTFVNYRGAAGALLAVQTGEVDIMCDQASTALAPVVADQVKPIGSTGPKRLEQLKTLLTLSEQGLSNFEISVWHGLYAPQGIPNDIREKLSQALQSAVSDPEFIKKLTALGAVPVNKSRATPENLERKINSEIQMWKKHFKVI